MRNILLEPTTKDNVSAKVALYKDLAKRHVIDNPQVSLQYVENKVEQSNNEKAQDIIVPPPLDVEELSRRAIEALEAYEESKRWKQQVLQNKKQQQISE